MGKMMLLIPKLRFPDYINQKEWDTESMETIFAIRNGYTPSKANPRFWDNGNIPWFRMEDIRLNGHILSDSIQHVTPEAIKGKGLFPAYSIIVATTATIGEHALIIVDSLANQQFTFLTKRKSFEKVIDMLYFHYYMFRVDDWCKKNTNSGGLLSVNMSAFKQLMIPYPIRLSEQQKIAECLSTIDSYISSINEKVEQLKAHKKSLLQKLFPQGGKIIPEYRFPEFEKDGSWEEKELGELILEIAEFTSRRNNVPLYSLTIEDGVSPKTDRYERNFLVKKEGDNFKVVHPDDFVSNPMNLRFGAIGYNKESFKVCVSGYYDVFRFKDKGTSSFWINYMKSNWALDMYDRIAIGSLYEKRRVHFSNLLRMKLLVPKYSERLKISEYLSSMEEVIGFYSEKASLLEQHKKGLMQQLFPQA